MLLLCRDNDPLTVDVLVILEKDNIDRIQQYDPAEFFWRNLPDNVRGKRLNRIGITFATVEEMGQLIAFVQSGNVAEAVKLVTRGWQYRPESGDHDAGMTVIRPDAAQN